MPIPNPFSVIEAWISEHGSAAILRDHVALLKSRMELLEKELANATQQVSQLETENKRLIASTKLENPQKPGESEKIKQFVEESLARLEAENRDLRELATRSAVFLKDVMVTPMREPDGFKKIRGLLWKPEGEGYEPSPYCPKCEGLLSQFPPKANLHWVCTDECGFIADWVPAPMK